MGWGVSDYPTPPEPQYPTCPVCGEECETIYMDWIGSAVGCDVCIKEMDAWEFQEKYQERG